LKKKKGAYGIEAEAVDGMDLMAVIDAADTAVQKGEVLENLIYWFAIPIVLRHTRCLMPNYIGPKRLTNGKEIPFRHSKLPVEQNGLPQMKS
jgi:hypothetical protein